MGHLKDIANQPKLQTFPNSTFEIEGTVPEAQCSEAKIESIIGVSRGPPNNDLIEVGKFTGFDLAGKICHIIVSPTGNPGDYLIGFNTNDEIDLAGNPGTSINVEYYISNGGELILTRNLQSFGEFIHATGYAYTIKGGKLYTNIPSLNLQPACSIIFDPLT